jgi:hypothetical protein
VRNLHETKAILSDEFVIVPNGKASFVGTQVSEKGEEIYSPIYKKHQETFE